MQIPAHHPDNVGSPDLRDTSRLLKPKPEPDPLPTPDTIVDFLRQQLQLGSQHSPVNWHLMAEVDEQPSPQLSFLERFRRRGTGSGKPL